MARTDLDTVEVTTNTTYVEATMDDKITISEDDARLIAMGKTPELQRNLTFWTICAYQIMYMASWSCLIIQYSIMFDLGGPMALVWGSLIVAVGQTLLMLSLAEYCSIWPTAGGQQYFAQAVSTPRFRPFLAYIIGWAVILSEIATASSCALNSAQLIAAFIEITHPSIMWHSWMTWILYTLLLIGPILINMRHTWLPVVNTMGAFLTLGGAVVWVVVFAAMAEPKHSAQFVFTEFINNSGYSNNAWVFFISFYTPTYALYGTDGILHMVEEMKDASKQAPRAIVWSMIFCSVTTWLSVLLIMWTAGDYNSYLEGSQPYLNWFMDVTKSVYGGGIFCSILIISLNFFVIVATNSASSRLAWSMAREKAFPCWKYFSKVNTKLEVPLRAMLAVLAIEVILGLTVLGSDLAFQSIVSAGGVTLQIGYATPIIVVLFRGRKILPARPNFDLGRWGYPINIVAVGWSLLVMIMFLCPLYVPVNAANIANMNWSIVIVGVPVLIAGVYWLWQGRYNSVHEEDSFVVAQVTVLDALRVPTREQPEAAVPQDSK